MTYKIDEKTGKVTLTTDELISSQYDVGMQNKKMEKQAIKGLTPKYCFKSDTTWQTIATWHTDKIVMDDATKTNDNRMSPIVSEITAPAKWLYNIHWLILGVPTTWRKTLQVYINGSSTLSVQDFIDTIYTTVNYLVELDQWDTVSLYLLNTSGSNYVLSGAILRVISYVLY